MNHDRNAYLYDISQACRQIIEFTRGLSLEKYLTDNLIRAAVERKFVTIGEAMIRLKRENPEVIEQISDAYRVIGFRNVLVHGYDIVDDATVWSAITDNVPVLLREVEALLG